MKIYELRTELDIQHVLPDDPEKFNPRGGQQGEPVVNLELPTFHVYQSKDRVANFFRLGQNFWLFDDKALAALGTLVEAAGQLFQIQVDGIGTLNVLNVLERCDSGLDHSRSRWRRAEKKGGLLEYFFVADKINTRSGLFILPEERYTRTYAVTGSPRQEGDFYMEYHDSGLTGLRFDLIWAEDK